MTCPIITTPLSPALQNRFAHSAEVSPVAAVLDRFPASKAGDVVIVYGSKAHSERNAMVFPCERIQGEGYEGALEQIKRMLHSIPDSDIKAIVFDPNGTPVCFDLSPASIAQTQGRDARALIDRLHEIAFGQPSARAKAAALRPEPVAP